MKKDKDDLAYAMLLNLNGGLQTSSSENIEKAVQHLSSAFKILDELGLKKQSEQIIQLISKIASKSGDPRKISDRHTKNLTSQQMLKNLSHHGTQFNMADDGNFVDDLLNLEVSDTNLEVSEKNPTTEMDFEDEI